MTEFLHKKYIEFMRKRYGVTSGICFGNQKELMCDFATEMAKEYIKQAQDFEEENKKLKKENAELDSKIENIRYYLDHEIPHELMNEATHIIWKMI